MNTIKEKKLRVLYPDSPFFVDVRLFETVQELQRVVKDKSCVGMYRPNGIVIFPKRKVYPKLGTIYLNKEHIGAGLIAHEVFHASMDYAHKKFNTWSLRVENSERQEEVAYFHGYMVKEIINWMNDKNLWK